METKSILQSKRSWLNYSSIIVLALTALLADKEFTSMITDILGVKGIIGMMVLGAILNQFLTQISDERPTFQMPKRRKSNLEVFDTPSQSDYTKDF